MSLKHLVVSESKEGIKPKKKKKKQNEEDMSKRNKNQFKELPVAKPGTILPTKINKVALHL